MLKEKMLICYILINKNLNIFLDCSLELLIQYDDLKTIKLGK